MGLQYLRCTSGALFLLGILQIIGNMQQRKLIVDDVFGDFFIDPDTETGWQNIQTIIEPHGNSKAMLTGATPSKPIRQGDGMFGPFVISKTNSNLCTMFQTAYSLGNIKYPDPYDDNFLRMWWNVSDMPLQNQESTLRWNTIITAYEIIHEIESTTSLMVEAIKPMYYSLASYSKTPMEVQFFAGDMMHGVFLKPDALCNVPWTTIDQFKTNDLLNPGIIDVMFNFQIDKLWHIPIPNVSFSGGGKAFPGCGPGTTFVVSDDVDCFDKTGSFSPDPPDPPDVLPGASGYVSGDDFQANVWKVSISKGTNPVDTGTVSISYKRLLVT